MKEISKAKNLLVVFSFSLVALLILWAPSLGQGEQLPGRRKIAVLDLVGRGLDKDHALTLTDRLRNEVVKVGKFVVLERSEMYQILAREQVLWLTDMCDSTACLKAIGEHLPVDEVLGGSVSREGDYWTVDVRLVNVETGVIKAATSVDCKDCSLDQVRSKSIPNAAYTISGRKWKEPRSFFKSAWFWTPVVIGAGVGAYFYFKPGEKAGSIKVNW